MQNSVCARLSAIILLTGFAGMTGASAVAAELTAPVWSPKAAAAYLDERASWWASWPKAARDNDTFCISCHTTLPYALSRASLHPALGEKSASPNEQKLIDNLVKRVRMWKAVEPFYPDQTNGLPKSSESRGTESILNSLALVWRDAPTGHLSADARLALDNMWALQIHSADMKGAWAWLQFHNAPFEGDSQFWGNTLAAIAIGSAPGNYKSDPAIQPGLKELRDYLQKGHGRANACRSRWHCCGPPIAKLPDLLTAAQQTAIIDETLEKQREDGGFSISTLVGSWKRKDNTPLDSASDGYATGLVAFTLEQLGLPRTQPALKRAITWLSRNQNAGDGRWPASSLNKERPLESDAGRFMSDAATAYAVLALESQ